MRTTLDIADDVLNAAKERARRENKTAGEVVSELLRLALTLPPGPNAVHEARAVHGLQPFPRRGSVVTNELIDQLRGDDAY
ncbi:MAG: antitoxin [Gammaproteobacteria bacterium]